MVSCAGFKDDDGLCDPIAVPPTVSSGALEPASPSFNSFIESLPNPLLGGRRYTPMINTFQLVVLNVYTLATWVLTPDMSVNNNNIIIITITATGLCGKGTTLFVPRIF